jgi:hypothetical protein
MGAREIGNCSQLGEQAQRDASDITFMTKEPTLRQQRSHVARTTDLDCSGLRTSRVLDVAILRPCRTRQITGHDGHILKAQHGCSYLAAPGTEDKRDSRQDRPTILAEVRVTHENARRSPVCATVDG